LLELADAVGLVDDLDHECPEHDHDLVRSLDDHDDRRRHHDVRHDVAADADLDRVLLAVSQHQL
jgi:hypothetical protein